MFWSLGRSISWLHFVPKKQVSPPVAGEGVWRSWRLSRAWSITRFAICFYILRFSFFDFEMAEAVINKVQWND